MDAKTEAALNLRALLKSTLTSSEPPEFPIDLNWVLEMRLYPHGDSEDIGLLPVPLQHLCVLALKLEEAFSAETHRRCVEIFGKEEYDNEGVEYGVHCDVQNDPYFNQAPKVWGMLGRRVRRHWPEELFTSEGFEVVFFVNQQFRVFKTKYRKKTFEEIEASIKETLAELEKQE